MFVLAAKFASYGLRLYRLTAYSSVSLPGISPISQVFFKSLNYISASAKTQFARLTQPLSRSIRRMIAESSDEFASRVTRDFNSAAKELGIPKQLHPELIISDHLPSSMGGAYAPASSTYQGLLIPGHRVYINSLYKFSSKLFPHSVKNIVRHEVRHVHQYLDIARSGLNSKLGKYALPKDVAELAESMGANSLTLQEAENRLEQAIKCIKVNKRYNARQRNLIDFIQRTRSKATGVDCGNVSNASILKELEKTLGDSKKLKAFEQEFWARILSTRKHQKAYLKDLFESEARSFGSFFGFRKLVYGLIYKA
jgi:hypothetical protein